MTGKKLVLLTVSLAQGGAETVVMQLALALRAAGWSVSVVSMLAPTAFVDELWAAEIPVVSLNMQPGRPNLAGLAKLVRYLRANRPDLLHSHMFHANIVARLVQVVLGIPIVSTIHSEIECSHRKESAGMRELLYRFTNLVRGRTTVVSESIRDRYARLKIIPAHRVEVIGNGVDPERFRPCASQRLMTRASLEWKDAFVWLAVGRLEIAKDYPTLIRAFQTVHQQSPWCKLAIAGDGRMRAQLERQIRDSGLTSAVSLLGSRTDIPELMNACDAFVMSSAWEGGPLVVLEAGATGCPVVATEVGVATSAIVPGGTGFLVAPGLPSALAQTMLRLMSLPQDELAAMRLEARRRVVEHFSLPLAHRQYQRLYEEVLA